MVDRNSKGVKMSSAKKKSESICKKCLKKSDCETKISSGDLILVRCLDFVLSEGAEKEE